MVETDRLNKISINIDDKIGFVEFYKLIICLRKYQALNGKVMT
jgi:hypothetical protein